MEIPEFRIKEFTIDEDFEKEGGQASVIKGLHSTHGEVAIKKWFSVSEDMRKEVELLKRNIYHQNIVQFLGILINKKSECIGYVMPYMPMGSLYDVIHDKSQQYDQKQIKSWMTQICYGLSYLHGKRIIHRDIKPHNVLLGKSRDDVRLSDFGMAKSLEKDSYALSRLGTALYVAPEVLRGEKYNKIPYDHIRYELDFLKKVANGERPLLNNNLSAEVSDLLTRCWHADASKRLTIYGVLEFFNKTGLVYTGPHNAVNGCGTSSENLNVHNKNENFSKTITDGKVGRLKVTLDPNHAEPKNAQNELAVVRTRDNDQQPPIPRRIKYRRPAFPNPIEQNPERQTILLLGGLNQDNDVLDSLLMLENNGQNWKELSIKMPDTMYGHGAQFLNNNLYIFGGYNEEKEVLTSTYKLSKSLQWENMADMNEKRRYISNSSAILNNQIWVCGGSNKGPLKSVEMYDPLTNKWKYMKEMNKCRWNAAAAVVSGKIFCCGGWDNSAECYDSSSDVWTRISSMPQFLHGHGAVEINGNLIVVGGYSYAQCLNDVWALDTTNKNVKWIEKSFMSIPRKDFSIANINDKLFVCGGHSSENGFDTVEIFDGEVWRNGPKMPRGRKEAPAVVIPMQFLETLVKDNIIAAENLNVQNNESFPSIPLNKAIKKNPGGYDGMKNDSLLMLENNGQNWKELNIKLPYAVYDHGAQFLNNNLYIFGGWNDKEGPLNWTYKLSKSLQWEKMADMNQKRWGISNSSVILNNQIWVCSGGNNSVEMYDPETNKWKYMTEMNKDRVNAAAAVVNGKIFCSGGWTDSVECYDPSSDVWTFVSNMPQPIQGHGAVEINGNLIVMGGFDVLGKCLKNVWSLDTTGKKAEWIEKPSMSIPRSLFSIAKIDDNVYVCGGQTGVFLKTELLNAVEFFDGKAWRNGPKMPIPRITASVVVIPMEFLQDILIQ